MQKKNPTLILILLFLFTAINKWSFTNSLIYFLNECYPKLDFRSVFNCKVFE